MNSQIQQHWASYLPTKARLASRTAHLLAGCALLFGSSALAGEGQQGSNPLPNRPIVIPNRTLSPDELRNLDDKITRRRNFDAANAARKQLIDDEANKILILARDLKQKTDKLGSDAPSPMMLREAAMIELLANDVKEKMKLTVNPN
jgi:hypothetical protein